MNDDKKTVNDRVRDYLGGLRWDGQPRIDEDIALPPPQPELGWTTDMARAQIFKGDAA